MTKQVYISTCVQALDGDVFRFALQAHYLLGNGFRFTLLKIGWMDARAHFMAVRKTDFSAVSVMEFSDRPVLTIWVTNTVKATLIYIKPYKIMDILTLWPWKWTFK